MWTCMRVAGEVGWRAREGHTWAPTSSWGYGNVSASADGLRERLTGLARRLELLICAEFLSAAIYTQWNDVESEANGPMGGGGATGLRIGTLLSEILVVMRRREHRLAASVHSRVGMMQTAFE